MLPFDADSRIAYLDRTSAILQRTQRRNQQARRSHFKTRRRRIERGSRVSNLALIEIHLDSIP